MSQIDLTAKLLATENINVVEGSVSTASFNIQTRQLTLPIWKDMTPEIKEMLVGHEVGHALYTTIDMIDASVDNRKLHSYINVVEDVRVERLMKIKYPGIRKTMTAGYSQLNERDFFGVSKIPDKTKLNLIDRMNLWFKVGYASGVTFSNTEKMFVVRAEKTETSEDVIKLAQEIFNFSKDQLDEQKEAEENKEMDSDGEEEESFGEGESEEDDSEEDDDEESEGDDDEESEGQSSDDSESEEESDEDSDLESITDKAFNDNLNDMADTSIEYKYNNLSTDYDDNIIVPYKKVLLETIDAEKDGYSYYQQEPLTVRFSKFKADTNKSVSYLVKEFEMRKAATNYKRTQISKSGSLDMKKIWGYQLNDDLFKKITSVTDGKNHGMIFLLDWSGSMNGVMQDTLEQVIQLATFCYRIQIPFQLLAFTDKYKDWDDTARINKREKYLKVMGTNTLDNAVEDCTLLEFFSDKMSGQEFNTMAKRLYNSNVFTRQSSDYGLGGTPLNHALAFMTEYVGKFIRSRNVEKMSFITLTDGVGTRLKSYTGLYESTGKVKNFVTDPTTKKTYRFTDDSQQQTGVLLQMIQDRYNTSNLGFYVAYKANDREIENFLYSNFIAPNYALVSEIKSESKKNGFASIKTIGRDDLFFIPRTALKIVDKELEVTGKQTARVIAKNFTKVLNGRQVNRILLNKFISGIS
jgi:hypothetical protein